MPSPPPEGTQKGDVYSFAIICQEIIYRKGTFWLEENEYISAEGENGQLGLLGVLLS